eukprot:3466407-Rhodomonas_salina.1
MFWVFWRPGVTFQSPSDGSQMLLTPEKSMQVRTDTPFPPISSAHVAGHSHRIMLRCFLPLSSFSLARSLSEGWQCSTER